MPRSEPPLGGLHPLPGDDSAVDTGWSMPPPAPAPAPAAAPAAAPAPTNTNTNTNANTDAASGLRSLPSKRRAEGTLLGVAPPRSPNAPPPPQVNPVVVHAGLSPAPTQAEAPAVGVITREAALPVPSAPQAAVEPPVPEPVAPELLAPEPPTMPRPQPPLSPPIVATPAAPHEPEAAPILKPPVAPVATAPHAEADAPTLLDAAALRVRALGVELPLWMFLAPVLVALLAACTIVAFALGSHRAAAPVAGPLVAAPAAPIASAATAAPLPTIDVSAIESKAPEARSAEEVLALAGATSDKKRAAAARFSQELLQAPASLQKKSTLIELRKLVGDPITAPQTLAAVADLPGATGPDLLYELWSGTPNKTDATELARSLLSSRDVKSRVSDALSVALALRAIEACGDLVPLLERTRQVGDKRSLAPLSKWKRKRSCSLPGQRDCCTKDQAEGIDSAIDAVKVRKAPFD